MYHGLILIVLLKNLKRLTSVKDVKMSNVEQYPNQEKNIIDIIRILCNDIHTLLSCVLNSSRMHRAHFVVLVLFIKKKPFRDS